MDATTSPGMTSGKAMRHKMRGTLHPSTCALSSTLRGMLSKNGSSTQMAIGMVMAAWVKTSAQ